MNSSSQNQLRRTEGRIPIEWCNHRAAAAGSLEFQECTANVLEQRVTVINEANAAPATFQQGKFPGSSSVAKEWIEPSETRGVLGPGAANASRCPEHHSRAGGTSTAKAVPKHQPLLWFYPLFTHIFGSRNPSRKLPTSS